MANTNDINELFRMIWDESMAHTVRRHYEEQGQMWNRWIRDVYGPYWTYNKHVEKPEIPEYLRVSEGL